MPDRVYVVPVIAHRLFGWRTVRFERPGVFPIPAIPAGLPSGPGFDILPGRRYRRELDPELGTARGLEEIEALFTPDSSLEHTAGITVQDYFAEADIGFELIAVADHAIDPSLAGILPRDMSTYDGLAARFNVPGALNLYLAKDLQGAWGRGFPDNPDEDDGVVGYAFLSDRYDDGLAEAERWRADVITTAHEFGHALGLLHRLEVENLMFAYGTTMASERLESIQHRICEYYARRYHRSVYAPDPVPHLVTPRADDYPFF